MMICDAIGDWSGDHMWCDHMYTMIVWSGDHISDGISD